MYAIAILRYRKPLEDVLKHVDSHRAYLAGLKQEGLLIASGPLVPRNGGALLLKVPDDEAQATLDKDPGFGSGGARQVRRHTPVGNVGVVKSRLKGLVLDQQTLVGSERLVGPRQRLFQPGNPLTDALRAGVIRSIREPERNITRAQRARDGG